jgi:hypothetical protein
VSECHALGGGGPRLKIFGSGIFAMVFLSPARDLSVLAQKHIPGIFCMWCLPSHPSPANEQFMETWKFSKTDAGVAEILLKILIACLINCKCPMAFLKLLILRTQFSRCTGRVPEPVSLVELLSCCFGSLQSLIPQV